MPSETMPSETMPSVTMPAQRMPAAIAVAGLITLVHLATQVVAPDGLLADVTQVMLMPALAAVLLVGASRPRTRLVTMALVALLFSWLGDTVPRFLGGDAGFLSMVGFFLVAQVVYAVAFWPWRDASVLRQPLRLAPYVLGVGVLVAWVALDAGPMAVPVVAYGAAIATMAVLATGLGWSGTLGGILFMVSDAMIALRAFVGLDLPYGGLWVMLTYVVAQALLVHAVLGADASVRSDAPPHAPGPQPVA